VTVYAARTAARTQIHLLTYLLGYDDSTVVETCHNNINLGFWSGVQVSLPSTVLFNYAYFQCLIVMLSLVTMTIIIILIFRCRVTVQSNHLL